MRFAYQYRLYPKQAQVQFLENQLHEACELYNAAFQERRDAWNVCRKSIHYYDQAKQLKPKGCSDWPTSPAARCAPPARRRSDHAGILPHPRSVTAASRGAAILPVGRGGSTPLCQWSFEPAAGKLRHLPNHARCVRTLGFLRPGYYSLPPWTPWWR